MIGQTISHYRILEKLGGGGMGVVYKAEDTKLGRLVALKFLPEEASKQRDTLERFRREARAASALSHPNICTIYEIDEFDGKPFIAMEFLDGWTLASLIAERPFELAHALQIGLEIADALSAAHSQRIVHRDVKPANILITRRGHAKVLDFGLAKMESQVAADAATVGASEFNLTHSGMVLGTIAYMSPEQARGESLDARSDVFSLGIVLYELLTGRRPFQGPSALSVMHEIATLNPPTPSTLRPELLPELDLLIGRALAKDKERRYPTATELCAALREIYRSTTSAPLTGAVSPMTVQPLAEAATLVGREELLSTLAATLRKAVAGSGKIVFLTGEPGIGKSALADAFLGRAVREHPGLLVSRGRCVEQYGPGEAYLPFLDAIGGLLHQPGRERVVGVLRTYAPTWSLQFPAVFGSSGTREQLQRETIGATKERMMREIGEALGSLASGSPLVLVLEDLHWADPSSVDLLRHLCLRIGQQRLLIVGTFRPADVESSNHMLKGYRLEMRAHQMCEEIALGLLEEKHISIFLNSRFAPNDFPVGLPQLLHRKTEGHPLFVTSVLQFLSERGDIRRENSQWTLARPLSALGLEVPESVRSMILKKMEALSEEDRRALQYASIEGEEFTSTILANLLGVDEVELEEHLDRLDRVHHWIQTRGEEELPDGSLAIRYRFSHALYQNVLYGELVSKRRIVLHRQVGERLLTHYRDQAPRLAAQLAMHFERGRDFARAVVYLLVAGDNATHVYANSEAEIHYTHALSLVEKLPREEQLEKLLTLYQKRGGVNFALSRFEQSANDYNQMLAHAREKGSPALECTALTSLATTLFWAHRMDEMPKRAQEALEAADRAGSATLRNDTMVLMALKHMCYGELDESKTALEEVVRSSRSLGHKPSLLGALAWRGALYFFQSEYARAEELLVEALELASELRDGFSVLVALFFLGLLRGNLGRMAESLASLEEAMAMARRNGDHFWFPRLPNCIGWVHRELGAFERALEYDQQGVEIARDAKVHEAEANSLINVGIDFTRSGENAKCLEAFQRVEDIFHGDDWFRWRYNIRHQAARAEHWLSQGNFDQAVPYTNALLQTATRFQSRKYVAVAHKTLAQIAVARNAPEEAEKQLLRSLEILRSYPVPVVEWRVLAALAQLHSARANTAGAREAFSRAAAIIQQIARNTPSEQLRSTFLDSAEVRDILAGSASAEPNSRG